MTKTVRKETVLAVDDDIYALRMLKRTLELGGYEVLTAGSGKQALELIFAENLALVLLDIMMPDLDGYAVCRRIREFSRVPVIIITARNAAEDVAKGLELGADDYIIKPFSSVELAARVKALLRRSQLSEKKGEGLFQVRGLAIDATSHLLTLNGRDIALTAIEYRIISYLAQNAGRILTPDQILTRVWGEEYSGENHILQVNIARIRRKVEKNSKNPEYIVTRPGLGYMMANQK